uniref:Uncharacterized protein n=1 Tax=Anguilla anguilla TaxID=7936 RepID=A0A0E9WJE3_ANGAN
MNSKVGSCWGIKAKIKLTNAPTKLRADAIFASLSRTCKTFWMVFAPSSTFSVNFASASRLSNSLTLVSIPFSTCFTRSGLRSAVEKLLYKRR